MSEKSQRRWFRFGLRSLLVVVTALCVYLAWETSAVRHRQAVLKEMKKTGSFQITTARSWAERYPGGNPVQSPARISLVRRMLGDEAIQEVYYNWYQPPSDAELARVAAAFPEAELRETLPEPCHPGCFPNGTLVETPTGPRSIESIRTGQSVTVIGPSGAATVAKVQSVFITDNRLWQVETEAGSLITTQTQPLCLTASKTIQAGDLKPGDAILRYHEGVIASVQVLSVSPTGRTAKVYNVILGDSQVFVAAGYLARSKPPATLP